MRVEGGSTHTLSPIFLYLHIPIFLGSRNFPNKGRLGYENSFEHFNFVSGGMLLISRPKFLSHVEAGNLSSKSSLRWNIVRLEFCQALKYLFL